MSENPCATCERIIADGATICARCGYELDAALAEITAYRGLAWDLDVATARQTHVKMSADELAEEKRVPGVLPATPLPYDPRVSEAAAALKAALSKWAAVVNALTSPRPYGPACRRCQHDSCEAIRRPQTPPESIVSLATWLRPWVGWLRHHHEAEEAYDDITAAVAEVRHVIDRPADKLYAGPCDCGEDLYARLGAEYITCRSEQHEDPVVWEVAERRRWLLEAVEDVLATTTEISRGLTVLDGRPVTVNMIYGWVHRDRLVKRGERIENGRTLPLYRVGDCLDILARQAERAAS